MGNVAQQVKQGRAHTQKVAKEVTGKFPQIKWMWTLGATGEHKEGRALDFMTLTDNQQAYQAGLGDKIKDYLLANRERLGIRSEEHTSELQSRENLVCRLLLEKK